MAFKYAIALTGSIGTGKSTVAKVFTTWGWNIIDADTIAHRLLDEHYVKITALFGKTVREGHHINRKALGAIVFSDKQKLETLETFLHPLIYAEIERLCTLEDKLKKPYFVDIPLFFETKRYAIEKSLVVYAQKALQLKRLMQRDGYNEEDAHARIATQIDIEEKKTQAIYVIDNSQDLTHLEDECIRIKEKILGDFK